MNGKRLIITTALVGLACTFGIAGSLYAQEESSSSACINCHTNLQKMDEYGRKASAHAAAIAG